uniref:SER_THR_PHOSPHATASE domain-containing protein n=1 Tax=Panagrellus redivivus TaxID=6233 RepID=A0A7E4ZTB7_PANRE
MSSAVGTAFILGAIVLIHVVQCVQSELFCNSDNVTEACDVALGGRCYQYTPFHLEPVVDAGCTLDNKEVEKICDHYCSNKTVSCMVKGPFFESDENAGLLRCCQTDFCNYIETKVLPYKFLGQHEVDERNYGIIFAVSLLGVTLMSIYPILYYLFVRRITRRTQNFDLNPFVSVPTFSDEKSVWPEDMSLADEVGTVTNILTLEEVRSVIHAIERDGAQAFPDIVEDTSSLCFGDSYVYGKAGHNMVMYHRIQPTKYEQVLYQMLEHGPGYFTLKPLEINEILDQAFNIFSSEDSLLELPAPINVIGDLRGQYADIFRWFRLIGFPPKTRVICLGGFFDGEVVGCIETLVFIAAMKIALPYNFFVLRGASEIVGVRLQKRFTRKICNDLTNVSKRMFSQMPLAGLINRKILCVHSGISKRFTSIKALRSIRRPVVDLHCPKIVRDILFNLPDIHVKRMKRIPCGHGYYFGPSIVEKVLNNLEIDFIIRARNASPEGYFLFSDRRMLTLWSAIGRDSKYGAVLCITENMEMDLRRIRTNEKIHFCTTPLDDLPTEQTTGQSDVRVVEGNGKSDQVHVSNPEVKKSDQIPPV